VNKTKNHQRNINGNGEKEKRRLKMLSGIGDAINNLVGFLLIATIISIPLAIWKIIEIIIWIYRNVHISWQ